jgi:hypothetical protein
MPIDLNAIRKLESERFKLVHDLHGLVTKPDVPAGNPLSDEEELRCKELADQIKEVGDKIWSIRGGENA